MSIFTLDALQLVEKTISSAANILQSFFRTHILLIKNPKSSPALLYRWFSSDADKQMGPLTIIFINLLMILVLEDYQNKSSVLRSLKDLGADAGQASLFSMVFAALVGSFMFDIYCRLISRQIQPSKNAILKYDLADPENTRMKSELCYSIIPMVGIVTFVLAFGNILPGAEWIVAAYLIFIFVLFFYVIIYKIDPCYHLSSGDTNAAKPSKYKHLIVKSALLGFFMLNIVIIYQTKYISNMVYPKTDIISIANKDDLKIYDEKCRVSGQTANLTGKILNKGSGPALLKLPISADLHISKSTKYYESKSRGFDEGSSEVKIEKGSLYSMNVVFETSGIMDMPVSICSADIRVMNEYRYDKVNLFVNTE